MVLLSVIIGLVGLYWQYQSRRHEVGGSLNATFHSRLLNNKDARTIVVCLEDSTIDLQDLYVTPTFDNPSEFSLKDFSLSFDVECTNIEIEPTSFVDSHKYGKKEWIFKYKDDILAAHDDTKKPFSSFHLKDKVGRFYIKTKASYDGAVSAFEYNTDVWFILEKNPKNLSFDNWKIDCKKRIFEIIDEQFYDVYYYAKDHQPEYQFDVALQTVSESSKSYGSEVLNKEEKHEQKPILEQPKEITESEKKEDKIQEASHDTEENSVSENNTLSDDSIIDSYVSRNMGSYIHYEVNLKKELESDKEYILKYVATDSLGNNEYEDYFYINKYVRESPIRKSPNQIALNLSGTYIKKFIKIISSSNTNDVLEISKKGDKSQIKNKTNSDVLCLFRYSGYSTSYRIISPGIIMTIDDMGVEPVLAFDLGTSAFSYSIVPDEKDGVWEYFLFFIFILSILTLACGTIFIVLGIIMYFIIGFSEGFKVAKKETIDEISLNSLKETIHGNEDTATKIWLTFVTISIYLSPILWIIFYLIYF